MVQQLKKKRRAVRGGDFVEDQIRLSCGQRRFTGRKFGGEQEIRIGDSSIKCLDRDHIAARHEAGSEGAEVDRFRLQHRDLRAVGGGGGVPEEPLRRVAAGDFGAVQVGNESVVIPHVEREAVVADAWCGLERKAEEQRGVRLVERGLHVRANQVSITVEQRGRRTGRQSREVIRAEHRLPDARLIQTTLEEVGRLPGVGAKAPLAAAAPQIADRDSAATRCAIDVNLHRAAVGRSANDVVPDSGLDAVRRSNDANVSVIHIMLKPAGRIDAQLVRPGGVRPVGVGAHDETAGAHHIHRHPNGESVSRWIHGVGHLHLVCHAVELQRLPGAHGGRHVGRILRAEVLAVETVPGHIGDVAVERISARDRRRDGCHGGIEAHRSTARSPGDVVEGGQGPGLAERIVGGHEPARG